MAIVRWNDPFREFARLQDRINRVFADTYARENDGLTAGSWMPPVDIFQGSDHEVVLKAELPGMTREAIEITLDNNMLTIRGEKKLAGDVAEDQYHRIERRYGTFSRSFSVPPTVDSARVAAEYTHGVLTVRLPLREESKPRQIKVDVAA